MKLRWRRFLGKRGGNMLEYDEKTRDTFNDSRINGDGS